MYWGALAVSCLFISHTCVCIYMCILFAHRDQKNVIREMLPVLCLSIILYSIIREQSRSCVDQSDALVAHTHTHRQTDRHARVYRCTFQRSAHDWSASFVCTLKGRRRSSQCLKRTLLLASMTNLFTTVVMLSVFMSISIVLIFCCVIYFYF